MAEREWILLNPGPANTSRSVREALVMPDLCHREPEFFEMMRECRERLVRLAGCADGFAAVLFTGSGTAAVEAAVCFCGAAGPGRPHRQQRRVWGSSGPHCAGPRDSRRGARVRRHDPRGAGRCRGRPPAPP